MTARLLETMAGQGPGEERARPGEAGRGPGEAGRGPGEERARSEAGRGGEGGKRSCLEGVRA